ncbi:MAG: tRNA 2-thiouridine(34) synthase MnmA [Firmicutes bacterium]|nr:tRNA 2-thiouridine(34) synthase MnmA [Bacillota bacterium]MDD3297640.1 tRNA 2-thiouridine(34) synthase MnmA [Bacillota bacterium]MDD3850851.1 tRNA 2-thiouridine(34) synthase MnmA [Bacillota bacterium]MDD4707491.1 tRNA 2-thiouridine(34) synthase MnmA [Bacillota bacterium]
MKKDRVVMAMSGGVDSSVAAALLLEKGYEVIGVTMQIWPDTGERLKREGGCCSLSAVEDARRVADRLGIPYYVMNFKDYFQKKVIDYFVKEYMEGKTPNPCIACNRYVKFEELLRRAKSLDAFYIATGHYAKIEYDGERDRFLLKKSITVEKDQTYALYNMTQYQLGHTLMPLGDYTKDKTRDIAKNLGLTVADKPDSQEICFVDDNNYGRFITQQTSREIHRGNFVDTMGNVLGRHKGIVHYTIGQRKGLGLALGKPVYVVEIDAKNNVVVIGEEYELFGKGFVVDDVNYISIAKLEEPLRVKVKIRYSAKPADAHIYPREDNSVEVRLDVPQRAITPGQSAVFYIGDLVMGGGVIKELIQ